MIWDKWIPKNYHYKKEVCAIEIVFQEAGTIFYYTHLKTKNGKLEVISTSKSNDTLQIPAAIEKNKLPLVVVVNGKGIILKKVQWNEGEERSPNSILQSNLSNLNVNDFYVQLIQQENATGFISLCRKDLLDSFLNSFKNAKLNLAEVFIGVPVVSALQPFWQSYNVVYTSLQTIQLTNNTIDAVIPTETKESVNFKIDDIQLTPTYVIGFASALSYLMRNVTVFNANDNLQNLALEHTQKNKLRFVQVVFIGIALLLSLSNVFFYSKYFTANNKLDTELNVYQGTNDEINRLLSDYQKKKDVIESSGVLNKNTLSEFADRIAITIPEGVQLTELYFNPQILNDEDTLVSYQSNQLIIKGNCNKSLIINEWENVLKMQKFIKDVSLEKFSYNNEGIVPNFEIKISTK